MASTCNLSSRRLLFLRRLWSATPVVINPVRRELTTRASGAILEEPQRHFRFGLVKVFATVFAGLSIGAAMSQKFAAFLEENELFVPDDDDDDDDDD